jgi:large subunit ribosomal protein L15
MPLQRRLPKRGFHSLSGSLTAEVRLGDLAKVKEAVIDLTALKKADLVSAQALNAKVYLAGSISKAVTLKGVRASKGARAAIEQAGGKLED